MLIEKLKAQLEAAASGFNLWQRMLMEDFRYKGVDWCEAVSDCATASAQYWGQMCALADVLAELGVPEYRERLEWLNPILYKEQYENTPGF